MCLSLAKVWSEMTVSTALFFLIQGTLFPPQHTSPTLAEEQMRTVECTRHSPHSPHTQQGIVWAFIPFLGLPQFLNKATKPKDRLVHTAAKGFFSALMPVPP